MRVLDITLKDILQILRDKKSLLFLIAMPLAFTLIMGMAYRGSNAESDPRLPLGWLDGDPDGLISASLKTNLAASGALRLVDMEGDQNAAAEKVRSGDLAGALIIPAGYSAALQNGQAAQVVLVADEAGSGGSGVIQVVRRSIVQALSSAEMARLAVATLVDNGALGAGEGQAEFAAALAAAQENWKDPAYTIVLEKAGPEPVVDDSQKPFGGNPYNQSSPGMLLQFVLFGLTTAGAILVLERNQRTLERMLTTSISRAGIVFGHLLAIFCIVFGQELILVVFGQLALGVNYLAEPLGTLIMMVTTGLWGAALGMLIGTLAKGEEQVIIFAMAGMFLFTALGGAWFPLETAGQMFATIGHLTPGAWVMDGFQNILIRGLGLQSVLLPAGIVALYALAFFALAVWRFQKN